MKTNKIILSKSETEKTPFFKENNFWIHIYWAELIKISKFIFENDENLVWHSKSYFNVAPHFLIVEE